MQAADKVIFCFFISFFFEIVIKQLRIIVSVSSEGIVGGVEFFCNGKIGHSLFLVGIIQTINYTAMVCMILSVIITVIRYHIVISHAVLLVCFFGVDCHKLFNVFEIFHLLNLAFFLYSTLITHQNRQNVSVYSIFFQL